MKLTAIQKVAEALENIEYNITVAENVRMRDKTGF